MIRNYLKIAWRNLMRNKTFSGINIISLAIGLSASLVIGLMVYYDLTFDKFHESPERIFRVTSHFQTPQGVFQNRGVAVPLVQTVREEFTGVETAVGLHTVGLLKAEIPETGKTFPNPGEQVFTDAAYFELIPYKWLAGNAPEALDAPNQVVLTASRANRYFPGEPPVSLIGRTLVYNDSISVKITGVVADIEHRTDFIFQEFLTLQTARKTSRAGQLLEPSWDNTNSSDNLFIRLRPGTDPEVVVSQLDVLAKSHETDSDRQYGQERTFRLQPLNQLHFDQELGTLDYGGPAANKSVLLGLGFIAGFLLFLGCANFINLKTAQADQRAREIGIRKTLGSSKKQLIFQFLGETLLLTLLAVGVSLLLTYWLLDVFREFLPDGMDFRVLSEWPVLWIAMFLIVLVTLLAGLYPAMVLARFQPVRVLKNQVVSRQNRPTLRRFLTVFQFTIAQLFIIATLLVGQQISYMLNKDLGFETEAVAFIQVPWHVRTHPSTERLVREIRALPQVRDAVLAGNPPASNSTSTSMATFTRDSVEIQTPLQMLAGGPDYIDFYGFEFLAGRKPLNDTILEYVINETYLEQLGFANPQAALGEPIRMNGETRPIVGVVRDFSQRSAREALNPLAILPDYDRTAEFSRYHTIHFKLQASEQVPLSKTLESIGDRWKEVFPESDFDPRFLDETVAGFYRREQSLSKLLSWAMGLSIVISCLGLLGLVIYTTNQRTKEIGIRKVLGASLAELNTMLCREFILLVGIAFLIAAPLAAWAIDDWLQDFAYRTQMGWWVFVLSGFGMLLLALAIMSFHTLRTAMKNPVHSLRTE